MRPVRSPEPAVRHVERVMGTVVSFDLRPEPGTPPDVVRGLLDDACRSLHDADAMFSTWKPESVLSRVRRGKLALEVAPPEVDEVLSLCVEARTRSQGWFDPWRMPGGVDPTGLVKGWAAARALRALDHPPVRAAIVNAGGDVVAFGSPSPGAPWRVGVQHPWRRGGLACVVNVQVAVATSGTYERPAQLVDPWSRRCSARAASATVAGQDLAIADALATALAVGGDDALDALDASADYDGYLIRLDGTERWTPGMPFADPGG